MKDMKKKIFGLALAAVIMSIGANAQTPSKENSTPNDKAKKECKMKDCSGKQKIDRPCVMDKLNLTDAQKAKLKEINEGFQAEKRALYGKAVKEGEAKRDSMKKEIRGRMMDLKRKNLNDIKAVLTADQYIQFLEESYLAPRPEKSMKKEFKKGMKPERPSKFMDGHKKGGGKDKKGHNDHKNNTDNK